MRQLATHAPAVMGAVTEEDPSMHAHECLSNMAHLSSDHAHHAAMASYHGHTDAVPQPEANSHVPTHALDLAEAGVLERARFSMQASVTRRVAYAAADAMTAADEAVSAHAAEAAVAPALSATPPGERSPMFHSSSLLKMPAAAVNTTLHLAHQSHTHAAAATEHAAAHATVTAAAHAAAHLTTERRVSLTVAAPDADAEHEHSTHHTESRLNLARPPWAWIRAVLLMTSALTRGGSHRPTSPDDVRDAALQLQLPVMGIDSQAQLLWLAVQFLNAPLPSGWLVRHLDTPVDDATIEVSVHESESEPLEYSNPSLRLVRTTHPLQQTYREAARNFRRHPVKSLACLEEVDALGWLAFADPDSFPYYYNFRTGQMSSAFPDIAEVAHSPLVLPRPLSLAQDAYLRTTPAFLAARAHVEMLLADGVATPITLEASSCAARAAYLWTTPLHLSPLLAAAQNLGIDPLAERHFMWIAHLSLCLPLPAGWVAHMTAPSDASTPRDRRKRKHELDAYEQQRYRNRRSNGSLPPPLPRVFYEQALLGFEAVQWEPPQISYCRGMLHALRKHHAATHLAPISDGAHATDAPLTPPPLTEEHYIQTAEAIRLRLRRQQTQVFSHGRFEVNYATSLTGAKRVGLKGAAEPR